jgi:hypothetical protein
MHTPTEKQDRDNQYIGTIDASGLSMIGPTTTTESSRPCTRSYTNGVNGNHPGTLAQDGDSVRLKAAPNANRVNENHPGALAQDGNLGRLNAAPNGAIATKTNQCMSGLSMHRDYRHQRQEAMGMVTLKVRALQLSSPLLTGPPTQMESMETILALLCKMVIRSG